MTIQEDDFILTSSNNDFSPFWDLEVLVTIKGVKGKESRQEFKNIGYGMPITSAIQRISKNKEDLKLSEYIKEFSSTIDKLYKMCNVPKSGKSKLLD
jgi:hypothetical protein